MQLNNTTALTIAYVSETGGNVQVVNAGGITEAGTITDAGGDVSLEDTTGQIQQYATGTITANLLTTSSVAGTTLNSQNAVGSFNGTNTTSGDIQLNNTTALTIDSISQANGYVQVINAGGISLTGAVTDAGGNVSLDETSGAINETSAGTIDADLLVAQSISGTTLNGTNSITTYVPITNGAT